MEPQVTLSSAVGTRTDRLAFEDATYRKVALRFIPFLMLCYVVAYLDRVNIGIAKLNMLADLQFSEAAYGLGAGLFFIGYMLFEVPSNLIMHRVGARLWIARIMISWGMLSGIMAFVTSPWQFYVVRFLLGVAEAGFYPGVILFLTYWFPNHRRARMTAIFQAGIPVAGLLGSPLSGWILDTFHQVGGHAGWQWVFVLEALPTLPLAVGVLLILTDRVKDAKWLSSEQRELIARDIAQDEKGRPPARVGRRVGTGRRRRVPGRPLGNAHSIPGRTACRKFIKYRWSPADSDRPCSILIDSDARRSPLFRRSSHAGKGGGEGRRRKGRRAAAVCR